MLQANTGDQGILRVAQDDDPVVPMTSNPLLMLPLMPASKVVIVVAVY